MMPLHHILTSRALERGLWSATVLITITGLLAVRRAVPPAARATSPVAWMSGPPRVPLAPAAPAALTAAATAITAADPFRLDRHPATVAYRPELDGVPPPPPPPKPPKPALTVAGLVGGPPWAALLDGVPGRDGSVLVHAGDVLGTLHIRRVTLAGVIVSDPDTTWHLTLKHPWP